MIKKFCRILKFIAESDTPPRVREISDGLDLTRATAYRLVSQLRDEGILQATETGGLELGSGFIKLIVAAASRAQISEIFESLMTVVAGRFEETAFLGQFDGSRVRLVNARTPLDKNRSYVFPGLGERPLHACSSSRAILAFLDPAEIARSLPERLDRLTDRTVADIDGLRLELEATRRRGYAVCDEEIDDGVTSVAVPVEIGSVGGLLSLGVVGPRKRINDRGIDNIGRELGIMVGGTAHRLKGFETQVVDIQDWII